MIPLCDNKSVGVVITNLDGDVLLLERARFPLGLAPPAGHVDEHGSYINAAVAEVNEEVGITLNQSDLVQKISHRSVQNKCRREGGEYHNWSIYTAVVNDTSLSPDPHETNGATWYSKAEVQELVTKTKRLDHFAVQDDMPVLELLWADMFIELGIAEA